jgi:hypothetical protein
MGWYDFLPQVDVVWLKTFFNKSLQLVRIHVIYAFETRSDGFRLGYILGRKDRQRNQVGSVQSEVSVIQFSSGRRLDRS